jgi:phage regulator Rha-like protein
MPRKQPASPPTQLPIPIELIERRIYLIRGQKVMLDGDLAELYEVPTKALKRAVRRNRDRFPEDFMLELNLTEATALRHQFGTLEKGRGQHPKYAPYAFTEHGVAMLSSVLKSKRAVLMNILIVRAFVRLREVLATHKDLARKMEELERTQKGHGAKIDAVYEVVKRLIAAPSKPHRSIGFKTD